MRVVQEKDGVPYLGVIYCHFPQRGPIQSRDVAIAGLQAGSASKKFYVSGEQRDSTTGSFKVGALGLVAKRIRKFVGYGMSPNIFPLIRSSGY